MDLSYTISSNHIKLACLVKEIRFKKRIHFILEELSKSYSILKEDEDIQLSSEEKKAMDSLMKTFVTQLKSDAGEIKSDIKDSDEIEKLKKEFPDVAELEDKIKEGKLNELVITTTLVVGILAALPKLIQLLGWLIKGVGSFLGKYGVKIKDFGEKIIHAGHDVHESYIMGIKQALIYTVPEFKTFPEKTQKKLAELVYVVIVMSLGIDAGVNAYNALQNAEWVHVSIEGLLSAIKGGELGAWLAEAVAATIETTA